MRQNQIAICLVVSWSSSLELQPWYERGPGHKPERFCDKLELSERGGKAVNVAFDRTAVVVAVAFYHTLLAFCNVSCVIVSCVIVNCVIVNCVIVREGSRQSM